MGSVALDIAVLTSLLLASTPRPILTHLLTAASSLPAFKKWNMCFALGCVVVSPWWKSGVFL